MTLRSPSAVSCDRLTRRSQPIYSLEVWTSTPLRAIHHCPADVNPRKVDMPIRRTCSLWMAQLAECLHPHSPGAADANDFSYPPERVAASPGCNRVPRSCLRQVS